jgi:hypothetical protein
MRKLQTKDIELLVRAIEEVFTHADINEEEFEEYQELSKELKKHLE